MFDGLDNVAEKQKFHIVHAGTLYYFQRVETFLQGVNQFLEKHPNAEIETTFFGLNFYPAQIDRIKSAAGKAVVNFTDKIPHTKMLEELASSHLQLLVATPEKHQIYGKVFDYMASGRPTLMVENDKGPLEWILSHQENSYCASTADEVANYIEELYLNRDKTKRLPRTENQFSRRKQTERFANLILETLKKQEA
jgi:glycosyltransferase involved in cell wall biosynthesis